MARSNRAHHPHTGSGGGSVVPQQYGGGGGAGHDEPSNFEPPDVFCALGSLIVEGRLPGKGEGGGLVGGRGYYEGPHVELPGRISRHKCSGLEYLCNKNENFRKHMLLLWQNNVPMSIEVLLCSDCRVGRAKAGSLEVTTLPEPGSILLEQWTIAILSAPAWREASLVVGGGGGVMDGLSLLQAVRSYLHFSQLSAWYSKTGGSRPKNLLIRITIPGEEFASKFSRAPEEHYFPVASVGPSSLVAVSVRSLPRTDEIPAVVCAHTAYPSTAPSKISSSSSSATSTSSSSPEGEAASSEAGGDADEVGKLSVAGALNWRDSSSSSSSQDLRRSLVKAKLAATETAAGIGSSVGASSGAIASNTSGDCPGGRLMKSDSMDSMLGDSLLDPPPSLSKMAPRRYQSPSRCGSPSLEAPDHLLGGRAKSTGHSAADMLRGVGGYQLPPPPTYDHAIASMMRGDGVVEGGAGFCTSSPDFRLNRHDLMRRRDLNLFLGLHPRLLHGHPRLSLPPKSTPAPVGVPVVPPPTMSGLAADFAPFTARPAVPAPCQAVVTSSSSRTLPHTTTSSSVLPLSDRLPNHCTISGKHICQFEEELDEAACASSRASPPSSISRVSPPSSSSSAATSPPSGDNYKQAELGAKQKGWSSRHDRSAYAPYSRDSSGGEDPTADSPSSHCDLRMKRGGTAGEWDAKQHQTSPQSGYFSSHYHHHNNNNNNIRPEVNEPDLSQLEMENVLDMLRSRSSPINNNNNNNSQSKERRRPSLKDDLLLLEDIVNAKSSLSRRSSLDEIVDCSNRGKVEQQVPSPPHLTQVYRSELVTSPPDPSSPAGWSHNHHQLDKADILLGAILKHRKLERLPPAIHTVRDISSSKYNYSSNCSSHSGSDVLQKQDNDDWELEQADKNTSNSNHSHFSGSLLSQPLLPHRESRADCRDTADINVGRLCEDLENKCLISREVDNAEHNLLQSHQAVISSTETAFSSTTSSLQASPQRLRSWSETAVKSEYESSTGENAGGCKLLEPLDMSFDEFDGSWSFCPDNSVEKADNYDQHTDEGEDEDQGNGNKSEKRRNSVDENETIPSANKKAAFRKSFDSATSMVFHRKNGLPLTSSPAPMRRGIKFDFDSGINTPKDIKRALFESQSPEDSECGSPKKKKRDPRRLLSTSAPASCSVTTPGNNLLGNFEESVLNGRLEPVSTVEGFTAEIGASGSFHPKHLTFPVTVFFYTLCENSNIASSSPYLGHINLGKKGYRVPSKGTIQITLFNPLGTVVKMFVVMYDLSDMPPNSQTFLRQRTLYMPSDQTDAHDDARKWLRYLIHIRLGSSKSGKIYLHTDVRMIIFRKSDMDTATDHEQGKGFELRSFTRGPSNPKFSPRR